MDSTELRQSKAATAARIYDVFLGGTHHFAADREAAEATLRNAPLIRPAARENRAFLGRAVRFAAESGIRQFLDIGSGIPVQGNVHEIAQDVDPEARVVYVDIDPVAVAEGMEILEGNPYATAIRGDAARIDDVLRHPAVLELLDFTEPVAVILCALLHFVPDDADAAAAIGALRDVSVPGSYLILSHGTNRDDDDPEVRKDLATGEKLVGDVYSRRTATPVRMRSRAAVERFFDGYDLVEPGVTWVGQWRPSGGGQPEFAGHANLSGILGGAGVRRPA